MRKKRWSSRKATVSSSRRAGLTADGLRGGRMGGVRYAAVGTCEAVGSLTGEGLSQSVLPLREEFERDRYLHVQVVDER